MNRYDNKQIDLHMHTTASDGTDTPEELVSNIQEAGIGIFSVTDHDAVKGSVLIDGMVKDSGLIFIRGVEFGCRDKEGKYHILGYGYDPESCFINEVVQKNHDFRIQKTDARLQFLKERFGFEFSDEDIKQLYSLNNPGKPHIANMMVRYGYAETKEIAIKQYINAKKMEDEYIDPREAIDGILESGGIPVIAHPAFGSGEEIIVGQEMDQRLRKLMDFGLKGIEAYYSGFTPKLIEANLKLAEKYNLYVTAGSDYHGKNKLVQLGDTGRDPSAKMHPGLARFLEDVHYGG